MKKVSVTSGRKTMNMKRIAGLSLALLALAGLLQPLAEAKSFLWEAKSGNSTVYLLGSIHMGKDTMYPLKPVIEEAFRKANVLAVEININDLDANDIAADLMYKDGKTLKTELSDTLYRKFEESFRKIGGSIAFFNNFKPTVLIQTLSMLSLSKAGYKANLGVDLYFLKKAKEEKKEIVELEKVEDQLNLLLGDGETDTSEKYLYYSLCELENTVQVIDSLMFAWLDGDAERMYKLIKQNEGENDGYDSMMKKLLDDRNFKMAEKVEEMLSKKNTYFVIVGSAHLVGETGIVRLLEKSGKYKIKQL